MSRENVELVRRGFEVFNRAGASGDLTELVQVQRELFDPGIEYIPVVEGVRICGYEDLLEYWRRWFEPWSEIRWDVDEVIEAGEQVIVVLTIVARGKGSGMEITQHSCLVFEGRDGKVVRAREYLMRDEALEAVGLSEYAMSQENVELVRHVYDAWAAGELDRLPDLLDPEVVWAAIEEAPDAGTYRGHEGVRAYMQDWLDDFDLLAMQFEEVIDAHGRLVVVQRGRAKGKGSGLETELHYAVAYAFRDGRLFRVKEYGSRAEALEAAGLSE